MIRVRLTIASILAAGLLAGMSVGCVEQKPQTQQAGSGGAKPVVVIETSAGAITVELWPDKAPITVENFLAYVDEKHFDGTIFHRVIGNFMIQGGGFNASLREKKTHAPIRNEARADTPNDRGTIAMARTGIVDSATAQFYINTVDNGGLNHKDNSDEGFGYCVFGKVIDGMAVVDKIRQVRTGVVGGMEDVPLEPVTILSVRRQGK